MNDDYDRTLTEANERLNEGFDQVLGHLENTERGIELLIARQEALQGALRRIERVATSGGFTALDTIRSIAREQL